MNEKKEILHVVYVGVLRVLINHQFVSKLILYRNRILQMITERRKKKTQVLVRESKQCRFQISKWGNLLKKKNRQST